MRKYSIHTNSGTKIHNFCLLLSLMLIGPNMLAQQKNRGYHQRAPFSLGAGVGMNYGTLGIMASYCPDFDGFFTLFGSAGYQIDDVAFAGGAKFRPLPQRLVTPTFTMSYGSIGWLITSPDFGFGKQVKQLYQPAIGPGVEVALGRQHYFSLEIQYFFLPKEIAKENNYPRQTAINLGFHFGLGS